MIGPDIIEIVIEIAPYIAEKVLKRIGKNKQNLQKIEEALNMATEEFIELLDKENFLKQNVDKKRIILELKNNIKSLMKDIQQSGNRTNTEPGENILYTKISEFIRRTNFLRYKNEELLRHGLAKYFTSKVAYMITRNTNAEESIHFSHLIELNKNYITLLKLLMNKEKFVIWKEADDLDAAIRGNYDIVLVEGPPYSGKTLLINYIALRVNAPFLYFNLNNIRTKEISKIIPKSVENIFSTNSVNIVLDGVDNVILRLTLYDNNTIDSLLKIIEALVNEPNKNVKVILVSRYFTKEFIAKLEKIINEGYRMIYIDSSQLSKHFIRVAQERLTSALRGDRSNSDAKKVIKNIIGSEDHIPPLLGYSIQRILTGLKAESFIDLSAMVSEKINEIFIDYANRLKNLMDSKELFTHSSQEASEHHESTIIKNILCLGIMGINRVSMDKISTIVNKDKDIIEKVLIKLYLRKRSIPLFILSRDKSQRNEKIHYSDVILLPSNLSLIIATNLFNIQNENEIGSLCVNNILSYYEKILVNIVDALEKLSSTLDTLAKINLHQIRVTVLEKISRKLSEISKEELNSMIYRLFINIINSYVYSSLSFSLLRLPTDKQIKIIEYFKKALSHLDETQELIHSLYFDLYYGLAKKYLKNDYLDDAENYFKQAHDIADIIRNDVKLSMVYHGLSIIYMRRYFREHNDGHFNKAINYINKAINIIKSKNDDDFANKHLGFHLARRGKYYLLKAVIEEENMKELANAALNDYKEAYKIANTIKDISSISLKYISLIGMAESYIYIDLNEYSDIINKIIKNIVEMCRIYQQNKCLNYHFEKIKIIKNIFKLKNSKLKREIKIKECENIKELHIKLSDQTNSKDDEIEIAILKDIISRVCKA